MHSVIFVFRKSRGLTIGPVRHPWLFHFLYILELLKYCSSAMYVKAGMFLKSQKAL